MGPLPCRKRLSSVLFDAKQRDTVDFSAGAHNRSSSWAACYSRRRHAVYSSQDGGYIRMSRQAAQKAKQIERDLIDIEVELTTLWRSLVDYPGAGEISRIVRKLRSVTWEANRLVHSLEAGRK